MARIKIKNSQVKDKAPLPADLVAGELAINTHADSPAIYLKDTAGAVIKIAGAGAIGGTPATETAAGIVELATAAETTTGTDNTRAVHPAGLKVELDKKANQATTYTKTEADGLLAAKAPLASPVLTGTPTAPTAAAGTNTTQLATTAFVHAATPDASATVKGLVQLADAAAVTAGIAGRVVDAAQLKAAVAVENLWDRTGTVVSPANAGDQVHTATGKLTVGGTAAAPVISLDPVARAIVLASKESDLNSGFRQTATTGYSAMQIVTTGGNLLAGVESAAGKILAVDTAANATVLGSNNSTPLHIVTNAISRLIILPDGAVSFKPTGSIGSSSGGVSLPVGATAWVPNSSESRLKTIVGDVDDVQAWGLIRDIQLKRYQYKSSDDLSVPYAGPMADWLGQQDPELLIDTGTSDDDGPIHTYNQGLLDMKALAALSAALKRIEQLEQRLADAGIA